MIISQPRRGGILVARILFRGKLRNGLAEPRRGSMIEIKLKGVFKD